MTTPTWTVRPGDTLIRDQIHGTYGGNSQAGISRSSSSPNVLVYSDHEKAGANGYDFDGWDQSKRIYYYTGEGKTGNQVLLRGNKAIAEHRAEGTALRLFVAVSYKPGTGTRVHQYVGQFAVDPDQPYLTRVAPGTDGSPRTVLVFRLVPVGLVAVGDNPHFSTIDGASQAATVSSVSVDAVPVAAVVAERSEVEKVISGPVVQKEAQLTERFRYYLETHQRVVKRYRIVPPGLPAIYSDLADVTANVLYEAKGSADRMSLRLALGQVLDYGRYVADAKLAVLLPEPPAADLVELLDAHDVGCVVQTAGDGFVDMTSLGRCPS
ncbi:hypothetical protein [Mycolicibacterium diernhoferi]|nr:hypothetical protein [Mycolicibacterium diernhoferi]QYL21037.1 hypothetical protein K0O62_18540 [Mycolicibacterium diernhoferi]